MFHIKLLLFSDLESVQKSLDHTTFEYVRVATFKLLGVYVSCDLKWSEHVDAIVSKAASRLHFLKQLKRAGAPIRHLLHFYISVLRSVLEYACPVWHSSLTVAQSDALESVQKRAISMIYSGADYETSLIVAGIDTLRDRREKLTARFFKRQVLSPAAHHSTVCFMITVTMTLSVDCEILNLSTQSEHEQINSVNHFYPIVWTITLSLIVIVHSTQNL